MEPWQFDPAQPAIVKIGTTSLTKLSLGSSRAAVTVTGTTRRSLLYRIVRLLFPSANAVTTPAADTFASDGLASSKLHCAVTSRSPALTTSVCPALRPVSRMTSGCAEMLAAHEGMSHRTAIDSLVFIDGHLWSAPVRGVYSDRVGFAQDVARDDALEHERSRHRCGREPHIDQCDARGYHDRLQHQP